MQSHFTHWLQKLCAVAITTVAAISTVHSAVPIPLNSPKPVPPPQLRTKNPSVLPLKGTWRFQLTHGSITDDGFRASSAGPAFASSSQTGNPPNNALDALRTGEKWCADGADLPQWWMADLQKPETVSGLNLTWEFPDAFYRCKIEGSLDRKSWQMLADKTAAPGAQNGPIAFQRATLRFLRITITDTKRGDGLAWACLRRVAITLLHNGEETPWTPTLPPLDNTQNNDFTRTSFDDKSWDDIPVPSNWEMQGFSRPTYDQPDDAVGLYRRWITIPKSFEGKRVLWHFDGVTDGTEVFLNGQSVGYHESGFTAFDIDVTKALKPGTRNLLALRVSKRTPSVDMDTGDYWCLGGVYRENYLIALPQTHVSDLTVVTDLDNAYKNAILKANVQVTGTPGATVALNAALTAQNGVRVPNVTMQGSAKIGADGKAIVPLQTKVNAPQLWSAEKPNLYFLLVNLKVGQQSIERVQQRFGFRQIDIKGGVLLWNGVPIKCTGTCRHEEWAIYGHALGEAQWQRDVELMKNCNINAVRTSHYNHAERFLELCDEKGLYVLDEVPGCWFDPKDPKLMQPALLRTQETLARDKNKPCVLAWSLGNESGYGPDNQAMLDFAKTNDPTRPAFISQSNPDQNSKNSFADYHYPGIGSVKSIANAKMRATTPAIFTEQPHIFYVKSGLDYDYGEKDLWGQVLAANWNVVWPTDSIVGSFIWEWQDQGLADKFPDKVRVGADGLRENNVKGIVDGYRNVKPEYWNIKMVYSPITSDAREVTAQGGNYSVPLQNRYSFTNLNELACRWQTLAGNKILKSGTTRVNGAPRASTTATFAATSGADTLRLEWVHPDGRSIYATRLHIAGTPLPAAPAPVAATGALKVIDTPQTVQVEAAGTQLIVDKDNGQIRSWKHGAQTIVSGGPILNLGEARGSNGEHGAKNFVSSKAPPQFKNVKVTQSIEGANARIDVTGEVFLVESDAAKGQLNYSFVVHPDAQIDVNWKMNWTADDANAWEVGIKLPLPATLDRMTWSRRGLWTEYPKGHIGADNGSATSKDVSFRSTKRDARWMTLTDSNGSGLQVLAEDNSPLNVRANVTSDGTMAFLSSQVSPPYDFSTDLVPDLLIHLKKDQSVSGSFHLRVAAK